MKNLKTLAILLLASTFSLSLSAQKRKKDKSEKEGEVRVITIKDENGEVSKTEDVFQLSDKKKIEKLLKEQGIELNLDDSEGTSVKVNGENYYGKKITVNTVTTTTSNTTSTGGKNGKNQVKVVNISNGEVVHSDDDLDVSIEQIDGGKGQKIVVSSKHNEFPSREIIVDANGVVEGDATAMVFIRKQTKNADKTDLPNSINQIFEGNASLKNLNLFPNPTNGNFKMEFTSDKPQDFDLSITDGKGAKVFEKSLPNFEGKYSKDFNLSKYDSGIYFFNLSSKGQTVSKKIVVQ